MHNRMVGPVDPDIAFLFDKPCKNMGDVGRLPWLQVFGGVIEKILRRIRSSVPPQDKQRIQVGYDSSAVAVLTGRQEPGLVLNIVTVKFLTAGAGEESGSRQRDGEQEDRKRHSGQKQAAAGRRRPKHVLLNGTSPIPFIPISSPR